MTWDEPSVNVAVVDELCHVAYNTTDPKSVEAVQLKNRVPPDNCFSNVDGADGPVRHRGLSSASGLVCKASLNTKGIDGPSSNVVAIFP